MDRLRPFVPEDVPAVVALRGRAFRSSLQPSPSAAERYFHETFFDDSPWRDARLPSWVYEDAAGRPGSSGYWPGAWCSGASRW